MPKRHDPIKDTLGKAKEFKRDPKADYPGVNTARDQTDNAPIGSAAASAGVGHVKKSATEAARGTSG